MPDHSGAPKMEGLQILTSQNPYYVDRFDASYFSSLSILRLANPQFSKRNVPLLSHLRLPTSLADGGSPQIAIS